MRKRLSIVFIGLICFFGFVIYAGAKNDYNTSLKDLKDEYAELQAEIKANEREQNKLDGQIQGAESDIESANNKILESEDKIKESKKEIENLNKEIELKEKEIETLLSFLQISDGDNVYLEYVFNATSYSDFIYRNAVVEQLTEYNDGLIDDMLRMIDENEKLQEKLKKQIEDSELAIVDLESALKKHNLSLSKMSEQHFDIEQDMKAMKKRIETYEAQYKKYGCKETTTIFNCLSVPYADGFVRPTTKGRVSSEYGMRFHPTKHKYLMHDGIDIGIAMNTPVYAAAAGIVDAISKVSNPNKANSSCGGNKVWIRHNIDGKEYTSVYMHLHSINVKLNQYVDITTMVGKSGGGEKYDYCTTGPHLHFGIKKGSSYVNPRNYITFPKLYSSYSSRF